MFFVGHPWVYLVGKIYFSIMYRKPGLHEDLHHGPRIRAQNHFRSHIACRISSSMDWGVTTQARFDMGGYGFGLNIGTGIESAP